MNKAILGILAVVVIAGGGWYWTHAQPAPDARASSTDAPPNTMPSAGRPLVAVTVPAALSAQAQLGEGFFNAVCASCHGRNAAGQDGVAPPLIHRIYEPSHHGDMAFVMAARNGVRAHHWPFGNMPPVEQNLTDAELGAIIAYVREVQSANGIN